MKTYRVWAKMTQWNYLDVRAEDPDQAYNIALETDGGEFVEGSPRDGDWEIDYDSIKEIE